MRTVKTTDARRAAALWVLAAIACGKADDTTLESSSSHWLRCDANADCAAHAGAVCGASGYCVDASGAPISVAGGAEGTPPETGAALDTVLPPGGVALDSVKLNSMRQMVVDEGGVIWLVACEGLFAIKGREVRRYGAWDSALADARIDQLLVDAQNRLWISNDALRLQVVADGAFQTVYEGPMGRFSVGRDGSVWVGWRLQTDLEQTGWVRQVAPELGEPIQTPSSDLMNLAVSDGGVWLGTFGGIYRWSDGAWSGPFGEGPAYLNYDPRQGVLWANDRRLTWNGSELEEEPLVPGDSSLAANLLGFDASGRLIMMDDTAVRWLADGQAEQTVPLSELGLRYVYAIGPDGSVYLANETSIDKLADGQRTEAVQLSRFDPELDFPWHAQPFGGTLEAPAIDAGAAELSEPDPELIGAKIHAVGVAFSGPATAGLWVDGREIRLTWADMASELSSFLIERERPIFVQIPEEEYSLENALGSEPPWDLYGYLETGSCFGPLGSLNRQFWIVEGYPQNMPAAERQELAAALRAQYPALPPK